MPKVDCVATDEMAQKVCADEAVSVPAYGQALAAWEERA